MKNESHWADLWPPNWEFLLNFPAEVEDGVEDVVTVQYEDTEDEEALSSGEDDVQWEHHLVEDL